MNKFLVDKYGAKRGQQFAESDLNKKLNLANLIIIDEISMLSAQVLDLIFYRLNDRKIPILVVGDFYQLPPVSGNYAFHSINWNFKIGYFLLKTII